MLGNRILRCLFQGSTESIEDKVPIPEINISAREAVAKVLAKEGSRAISSRAVSLMTYKGMLRVK